MSFIYAPRGPVCDMHNTKILSAIFTKVKELAEKYNAIWLRLDPLIDENDTASISNLCKLGFKYRGDRVGYENTQCRENYILDIKNKSVDEVFLSFRAKCRYNIRLAQRKGVSCSFYGEEKLDDFYKLMKETSERDGFEVRSKEYFSKMLKSFGGRARLCMCYLDGIPLSGALFINYAGTVSYVYGCSSNQFRNCMPNYLMQWTMIKYAIEEKCDTYDFCGIPYWNDPAHKNYGVYKFKRNFNGEVKIWAGEFEYIFKSNVYHCVSLLLRLRETVSHR